MVAFATVVAHDSCIMREFMLLGMACVATHLLCMSTAFTKAFASMVTAASSHMTWYQRVVLVVGIIGQTSSHQG